MTFEEARPQQTSDPQVCLSVCLSSQHFHAETSSRFLQYHILLLFFFFFFLAMPRDCPPGMEKAPDEQPPAMRTCSTCPPPLPWLLTTGVNKENRKPRPYSTILGCYTSNQHAGEYPWLEESPGSSQSWVLLGEQTGGVLEGLVSPKGTSFVTCTLPFSPARLQVCSALRLCVGTEGSLPWPRGHKHNTECHASFLMLEI